MSTRSWSAPLLAGLAPLAMTAGSAFASGPVDHFVGVAPRADATFATLPGGSAMALPGVGDDFVFATGAQFVELPRGRARLIGVMSRVSDPRKRFLADLTLQNRVNPGNPTYPPPASPVLELAPTAYTTGGGIVDPNAWHYWTSLTGTLTGLGDLRGAKLLVNERGPAFQCGSGANGRSLPMGASGTLRANLASQPFAGPALPLVIDGETHLDLATSFVLQAKEAVSDASVAQFFSHHAFYLPGLGDDFVFVAGGELQEESDGSAELTGVVARVSNPLQKFFVDVHFGNRTNSSEVGYPPAMSPHKELQLGAYVDYGGPVDPNHWYYYESYDGTLVGLDDFAGLDYAFTRFMSAFQVGVGANGKNLAWGGSGWITLARTAQPQNGNFPLALQGDINLDLTGEGNRCTNKADALAGVGQLGGHAVYLNGIGDDFVFQPGGQFNEFGDGTATLQGLLVRTNDPSQRFLLNATFGARVDPLDPSYPPAGSPKMELVPAVYVSNGGAPIDTNAWHYYGTTTGTLIGQGAFTGASYSFTRFMQAFQVGLGANGKNLNFGGSGWISLVLQSPAANGTQLPSTTNGDFNFDFGSDCPSCALRARTDPNATFNAGNHAFYLPGIGANMVWAPGARFVELEDGTAHLTGTIYRERVATKRFDVDIWFTSRVDPGGFGFAPSGSPKKELYDWMYVENGGPIDTDTWHYYQYTDGFLTGQSAMSGALLSVSRFMQAFQVGLGANGKNIGFGASGWLDVTTLAQPSAGPNLPQSLHGDVNINLTDGCP